jgi:hypothetical protein
MLGRARPKGIDRIRGEPQPICARSGPSMSAGSELVWYVSGRRRELPQPEELTAIPPSPSWRLTIDQSSMRARQVATCPVRGPRIPTPSSHASPSPEGL